MKNFCLDLREHATKIINYEKKEMILLTKKEQKRHNKQKEFVIYVKKDLVLMITMKNILRFEIIVIILENIEEMLMISAT